METTIKKTDLTFIGVDSWGRPVYRDINGQLWKDIDCGCGKPELYSAWNNDFDGEPYMPIEKYFPDFEY